MKLIAPKHLALFSLVCAGLGACQTEAPSEAVPGTVASSGTVVAEVNGNPVTQEMVDATLRQLPAQLRAQLEQTGQIDQVKEQVIVGEVLYREALARNVHQDPDVQLTLALVARTALADAVMDKVVEERMTDEMINTYYQEHMVQFAREQIRPALIHAESDAAAAEITKLLAEGADFATLAQERSKDPNSAAKKGDLGWISKRDLPPNLATPLFEAEKGTVIEPISSPNGVLIFKVEDKRSSIPLEDVREQIESEVKQTLATTYIEEVRQQAAITRPGADNASVVPTAEVPAAAAPQGEGTPQ